MSDLPTLAITVGDVAGVGPEIAMACAMDEEIRTRCVPKIYGPKTILNRIADQLGLPFLCDVVDIGKVDDVSPGRFSARTGRASFEAFDQAVGDALAGAVDAVVTGPIQKEAWHLAGVQFPGHTETLAARTSATDYCMMLTSDEISCVLATIHVPLADVAGMLTVPLVTRSIKLGAEALQKKHRRPARVVVCGLNPHAGENGMFSHGEEKDVILPAVDHCRSLGIDVLGPVPPDTAFTPAMRSQTDVYVCMYHDQGLIPLKALSFDDAVNVTLGLPIVRTSVDHGTAMDLAWQGRAKTSSMMSAIKMAIDLGSRQDMDLRVND